MRRRRALFILIGAGTADIIVKASKHSEAGRLPSQELLAAMGKYNEELIDAGELLSGEGLQPSSKGAPTPLGRSAHRHRRPIHRDQRADRQLLAARRRQLAGATVCYRCGYCFFSVNAFTSSPSCRSASASSALT